MSQQATMTMTPTMGGPVGAVNASTPNHAANVNADPSEYVKRLNTYIYDYFIRNQHYACARSMLSESLPLGLHNKSSPGQRQANGLDDLDMDLKDADRPKDLLLPDLPATGGHFLEDWWVQFWETFNSRRSGVGKAATISYLAHQRQLQKARSGMMGAMDPQTQRAMMNGAMQPDLKKAAMVNAGQMNPQMQAALQAQARARVQNQQQMAAGQMERQGSQMDAHSGSPGSGGAPSPKRPRVDGNMQQQMAHQRPGQPGHMPNQVGLSNQISSLDPEARARTRELLLQNNINPDSLRSDIIDALALQPTNHQQKSLEAYTTNMKQQASHALSQAQAHSNMTKGMPPNVNAANMLQTGSQGSPMPQPGMEVMDLAGNGLRHGMLPNNAALNIQGAANTGNGSHALQDYQMQLMLLEQQNKRRLMMARGEQENLTGHTGVPVANGQFAPNMSPSGRVVSSPNPNDMTRGTPKMNNGPSPNALAGRGSPGPNFDPNAINAMRNQLMLGPNGQMIPRSTPMNAQMEILRQAQAQQQQQQQQQQPMMANGTFAGVPGMPPNMMPGQPIPQPGQVPPNMTPRQGNNHQMPPPPAPQPNASGTQPSSPAPVAAPPTPNQTTKAKPGSKKESKAGKGSNKKAANANAAAATAASEAEQPPTPTPQTPLNSVKNFNQAAAPANGGLSNGQINGQGSGLQLGLMQPAGQDLGVAPFGMDNPEQFMISDFAMDNSHGDVLDNFDFDAFLQNTGDDGGIAAYSEFEFNNGAGVEAGDALGQ